MKYLYLVLLFCSFGLFGQSQGVTNSQTKLRPNQLRWSPTDATLDSVYIIRADTATGEPGWYLVTLGGSGVADTTLSGDVVGGLNSTFVRKINGVTVENKTPQGREVLTYNGTQWTPDSIDLADLPQLNASRLLGRGSTTNGAPEQITAGTGLRISTNILETYMQGGTGITLSGASPMTITNSLPDQTVSIAGGGINSVSGTYPTFTVTGTEVDGSTTNEIQTIDTLTVASNLLRLKLSGSAVKTLAMSNFATTPAGSSMQVQYNNAGAFGALDSFTVSANPDRVGIGVPTPTARLDIQGSGSTSATNALRVRNSAGTALMTLRNDGQLQVNSNTEASKSSLLLSGTGYSGGTATTTKPTLLIEPTGTTSTGWSTLGTKLGINAESGFTGNLLDLQVNGVSQVSLSSTGFLYASGARFTGAIRTTYINNYDNSLTAFTIANTTGNTIFGGGLFQFGGTTSSFPAIKRNGTGLDIRLADNSGFAPTQSLYDRFGSGSPESVVTAPVGAVYHRTDGGAGTSFYVKESGTSNTGWVAK